MERQNVARMGEIRRAYKLTVGKPEGKGALGRPRRRWDGNMKGIQDRIRKLGVDSCGSG